jgi:poly(3-hydroxybutyrate) depolymerase
MRRTPILASVIVTVLWAWTDAGRAASAEKTEVAPRAASAAARPSAGCGKSNPPTGAQTIVSQGGKQAYLVSLPPGYDPGKPSPLGFAFHGYQRNHINCRDEDCPGFQDVVGQHAVVVYMKSITEGWDRPPAVAQNTAYFKDVLAHMKRNYCIDESRVFVAGTSSGAGFANHLGCKLGDQLLAIAPVHGPLLDRTGCKGHPAVLAIHGIADKVIPRSYGESARDFFLARNGCQQPAKPDLAAVEARIQAARQAGKTVFACVDYPNCSHANVRWCVHSEAGYEDLNHGWPTLGGQTIWDFVSAQNP